MIHNTSLKNSKNLKPTEPVRQRIMSKVTVEYDLKGLNLSAKSYDMSLSNL